MNIGIVGAGNIGGAIAQGLLESKKIAAQQLFVSDVNPALLERFATLGASVSTSNEELAQWADLIIIAVKPAIVQRVVHAVRKEWATAEGKVLVSVAAGISIDTLLGEYGKNIALFRVIPNTAIAVGQSMTVVASANASKEQEQMVENLFCSMGPTMLIAEEQMTAATALSSCGIAFAMRYLSANMRAGVEIGFAPNVAKAIMLQTLQGAVSLLTATGKHPEEEIDRVTTPKGFTIKGLNELEHRGFSSAVIAAVKKAM